MKSGSILIAGLVAGALSGCSAYDYARDAVTPKPGGTVEFVSANSSSVLIDFGNNRAGEMQYADTMAKDKCAIFGKSSAALESLNPRGDDRTRAAYLCQ
jgi:hypothetical protein